MNSGSGEHAIDLSNAPTDPAPPPSDPELCVSTIPPAPTVPNLELTTYILEDS